MKFSFLSIIFLFCCTSINAQTTNEGNKKDSASKAVVDSGIIKHSPRKATIYSAVLPGLGQFYNKKYWKIPIIYTGAGVLTYFIVTNNKDYVTFRNAFKVRVEHDTLNALYSEYIKYTPDQLQQIRDYYRRNRDLSYILSGLLYILNIVDADVDAHLFFFDVSDKLTLNWRPSFYQASDLRNYPAISFKLNF